MKKVLNVFLLSMLLLVWGTACENNDEPQQLSLDPALIEDAESEAFVESTLDEVDNIAYYAMLFAESGRVAEDTTDPLAGSCVTRSVDKENRVVTITFSEEGCPDWRGRIRKGTIIIDYDGRWFEPGSMQTITFVDFSIDGRQISGEKVRKNVSDSIQDFISFEVSFDITVTFENETTCSREGMITRTRIRMPNPIDDQIIKKGTWSGTNCKGYGYVVSIDPSNPVVWQRGCLPKAKVFIPVSGLKHKTVTDPEGNILRDIQIDYGDGTCDNMIQITNMLTGAVQTHEVKRR